MYVLLVKRLSTRLKLNAVLSTTIVINLKTLHCFFLFHLYESLLPIINIITNIVFRDFLFILLQHGSLFKLLPWYRKLFFYIFVKISLHCLSFCRLFQYFLIILLLFKVEIGNKCSVCTNKWWTTNCRRIFSECIVCLRVHFFLTQTVQTTKRDTTFTKFWLERNAAFYVKFANAC